MDFLARVLPLTVAFMFCDLGGMIYASVANADPAAIASGSCGGLLLVAGLYGALERVATP